MGLEEKVYDAVCVSNWGVDEDPDVEMIIDDMFNIARMVSQKMFQYGALYEKEMLT